MPLPPNHNVGLHNADYSQAELRILATVPYPVASLDLRFTLIKSCTHEFTESRAVWPNRKNVVDSRLCSKCQHEEHRLALLLNAELPSWDACAYCKCTACQRRKAQQPCGYHYRPTQWERLRDDTRG